MQGDSGVASFIVHLARTLKNESVKIQFPFSRFAVFTPRLTAAPDETARHGAGSLAVAVGNLAATYGRSVALRALH